MQGKGAGAVNRVELECQVLCASLRQSWVRHDKVGAFTSIRELSHLFPDLLPPPEEERNGSNKANYYEVLSIRPQAGLNGIVVGYLRTVRKFLMQHNPKDYRQHYNTILNAGFILRKPRLRLSHDLVVARRWLFESQMEDESTMEAEPVSDEMTPVATPPAIAEAQEPGAPERAQIQQSVESVGDQQAQPDLQKQAEEAPVFELAAGLAAVPVQASAFEYTPPIQAEPVQTAAPDFDASLEAAFDAAINPAEAPSEQLPQIDRADESKQAAAAHTAETEDDDDDYDPLAVIERSWQLARFTAENKKPVAEPPAASAASAQSAPPNTVSAAAQAATEELARPLQTAYPSSQPAAAQFNEPSGQMQSGTPTANLQSQEAGIAAQAQSYSPQQISPPQTAQDQQNQLMQSSSNPALQNPALQNPALQNPAVQNPAAASTGQAGVPAETRAGIQTSPAPAVQPNGQQAAWASAITAASSQEQTQAREQRQQSDNFVFDEKQLRKPEAEIELPTVIRLLEAAHLITKLEVQALKAQLQLAPNISGEQLCINAGYVSRTELASLRLAENLLSAGKITMAQFAVAMYDERTSGLRMAESLQVRGWLDTEVRNSIEEFKKNNS